MSEARERLGWCVVLAAGLGRRMGGSKALMVVDGEVWWRRQMRVMHAVGVRCVWVVSEATWAEMCKGGAEEMLRLNGGGVVFSRGERAMMSSVVAGLRGVVDLAGEGTVRGEGVFVLPVDVPAGGREVWGALRGAMKGEEGVRRGSVAAVPRVWGRGERGEGEEAKRGHPVLLSGAFVLDEVLLPARRDEAWVESARLDELLSTPNERRVMVDVADRVCVMNLNTAADVRGM